jgi:signal transduction histidine kinase
MRLNLATRFSATIVGVLALSILSSLVALYAAYRVNRRLEEIARESMPSVRAEDAEIILVQRHELLAMYLLDGEQIWLDRLGELKPRFERWLAAVRSSASGGNEDGDPLRDLEQTWASLDARQNDIIAMYKRGDASGAKTALSTEINSRLSSHAEEVCARLVAANSRYVNGLMARAQRRIRLTTWLVGVSGTLTLVLGGLLLWLFFYRVLLPLRGMVADAELFRGPRPSDKAAAEDELRLMGSHFRSLMSDVADTRTRLQRSHDRLAAAEKLASVGKLAASVAHEIRNPLTAMKMWLFSAQEAVRGNLDVERKLAIVSEEIGRLESTIRDFLEFSRPSTLQCKPEDVGRVIERTLELLGPRLAERKVRVTVRLASALPPIMAELNQLKQVFINLLANAADAMEQGGEISISTTAERDPDGQAMVVVRVADTGSGMPEDVQRRIFEPFFTTKDAGTGLGLCIAAQIMVRHGGLLVLESSSDRGTVFAAWTPIAGERSDGQNPRS